MATERKTHPRAERVAHHAAMATAAFSRHVVETRFTSQDGKFRSYRCARPDDSAYFFNVTFEPGRVLVTGDIGTLVVERTTDMVAWCRGSIESIDYFAEKVPHEIPTEEYDGEVVQYWVEEQIAEADDMGYSADVIENLKDMLDEDEFENESRVKCALSDSGACDDDWPRLTNYSSSFLWCREAIKFLLANMPE